MFNLIKNIVLISLSIFHTILYSQHTSLEEVTNTANTPLVTATIDAKNSEAQLKDLQKFFLENEIQLTLKKLARNEAHEITRIHIILEKGTDRTEFSSSANYPIPKLTLGFKDNAVFIHSPALAIHNRHMNIPSNMAWSAMAIDSLFQQHGFPFQLNSEDETQDFFGMSTIKDMMEQFMTTEDTDTIFHSFQQLHTPSLSAQKFRFIDNPSIQKLIIIDGKESDFNTLNTYAMKDQLAAVDVLQSKTAISLYGDKAKDGVIIATTKR